MVATFTAVDLSRLPPPSVVEVLDFETIRAEMIADLQERLPSFDATVESDPAVMLLEAAAYRELLIRQRINDAARAVMVAFAVGADLDQLAALLGVARQLIAPADPANNIVAIYESDDDFRRRITLAPEGFSVAGPEGAYIYHALSADARVLDASVTSPAPDDIRAIVLDVLAAHAAPGELVTAMTNALDSADWPGDVIVSILARVGNGAAGGDLVTAVDTYLSADTRRPMTDAVTVQSAEIVNFAVEATVYTFGGPDPAIVLATGRAQLDDYLARSRRIGRDITRAGIIAALGSVEGVQNVVLTSPAADVVLDQTQAGNCTGVVIHDGGVAE